MTTPTDSGSSSALQTGNQDSSSLVATLNQVGMRLTNWAKDIQEGDAMEMQYDEAYDSYRDGFDDEWDKREDEEDEKYEDTSVEYFFADEFPRVAGGDFSGRHFDDWDERYAYLLTSKHFRVQQLEAQAKEQRDYRLEALQVQAYEEEIGKPALTMDQVNSIVGEVRNARNVGAELQGQVASATGLSMYIDWDRDSDAEDNADEFEDEAEDVYEDKWDYYEDRADSRFEDSTLESLFDGDIFEDELARGMADWGNNDIDGWTERYAMIMLSLRHHATMDRYGSDWRLARKMREIFRDECSDGSDPLTVGEVNTIVSRFSTAETAERDNLIAEVNAIQPQEAEEDPLEDATGSGTDGEASGDLEAVQDAAAEGNLNADLALLREIGFMNPGEFQMDSLRRLRDMETSEHVLAGHESYTTKQDFSQHLDALNELGYIDHIDESVLRADEQGGTMLAQSFGLGLVQGVFSGIAGIGQRMADNAIRSRLIGGSGGGGGLFSRISDSSRFKFLDSKAGAGNAVGAVIGGITVVADLLQGKDLEEALFGWDSFVGGMAKSYDTFSSGNDFAAHDMFATDLMAWALFLDGAAQFFSAINGFTSKLQTFLQILGGILMLLGLIPFLAALVPIGRAIWQIARVFGIVANVAETIAKVLKPFSFILQTFAIGILAAMGEATLTTEALSVYSQGVQDMTSDFVSSAMVNTYDEYRKQRDQQAEGEIDNLNSQLEGGGGGDTDPTPPTPSTRWQTFKSALRKGVSDAANDTFLAPVQTVRNTVDAVTMPFDSRRRGEFVINMRANWRRFRVNAQSTFRDLLIGFRGLGSGFSEEARTRLEADITQSMVAHVRGLRDVDAQQQAELITLMRQEVPRMLDELLPATEGDTQAQPTTTQDEPQQETTQSPLNHDEIQQIQGLQDLLASDEPSTEDLLAVRRTLAAMQTNVKARGGTFPSELGTIRGQLDQVATLEREIIVRSRQVEIIQQSGVSHTSIRSHEQADRDVGNPMAINNRGEQTNYSTLGDLDRAIAQDVSALGNPDLSSDERTLRTQRLELLRQLRISKTDLPVSIRGVLSTTMDIVQHQVTSGSTPSADPQLLLNGDTSDMSTEQREAYEDFMQRYASQQQELISGFLEAFNSTCQAMNLGAWSRESSRQGAGLLIDEATGSSRTAEDIMGGVGATNSSDERVRLKLTATELAMQYLEPSFWDEEVPALARDMDLAAMDQSNGFVAASKDQLSAIARYNRHLTNAINSDDAITHLDTMRDNLDEGHDAMLAEMDDHLQSSQTSFRSSAQTNEEGRAKAAAGDNFAAQIVSTIVSSLLGGLPGGDWLAGALTDLMNPLFEPIQEISPGAGQQHSDTAQTRTEEQIAESVSLRQSTATEYETFISTYEGEVAGITDMRDEDTQHAQEELSIVLEKEREKQEKEQEYTQKKDELTGKVDEKNEVFQELVTILMQERDLMGDQPSSSSGSGDSN